MRIGRRNLIDGETSARIPRWGWRLAILAASAPGCMIHRNERTARFGPPPAAATAPVPASSPREGGLPSPLAGSDPGPTRQKADPAARAASAPSPADGEGATISAETPRAVPPPAAVYAIDLTAALRLAEVENPRIGEARARIGEALALQKQARALLLPTLNAGANYHGHTGIQQRSSGRILSVSEQSLYFGGGARTFGTQTVGIPGIWIYSPITDAIFEPLAARQNVEGARFSALATANSILLEVARLYLELEGAEARFEAARRTVAEAAAIANLTAAYSKAGVYPESDADRASTELKLFQVEVQRAEEEVAVASARLVQRLHLEPNLRVHTDEAGLEPISLVDAGQPIELLVLSAIRGRPEMRAAGAAVAEAEIHLRQEKARPFLPTVSAGVSGGDFGGGSNLATPLLGRFAGRTDADVFAFWTLENFGFGNAAIQKNRRAAIGQAEAERSKAANQIRREVLQAVARSAARFREIEINRVELASAEAGYREDMARARGAVGRPIEVLDSTKILNRARQNLIRSIVGFDQAQFSLFVALGSPPPLTRPATDPLPAAPLASPIVPPPLADTALPPRIPRGGHVTAVQ